MCTYTDRHTRAHNASIHVLVENVLAEYFWEQTREIRCCFHKTEDRGLPLHSGQTWDTAGSKLQEQPLVFLYPEEDPGTCSQDR